ncbi:hypothetical protein BGW42_007588 [Actinomortierella wolfii]|nr:hypothetical protein BGW42_007588 [Actinomortierella wolfii]
MTKKTIFITGATGFIGQVVAKKAVQQGYNVRGLSRREEGDRFLESIGVTPVRGELTSADVLSREAQQADIVLHLAFNHDFSKGMEALVALDLVAIDALAAPLVGTNKPLVITCNTAAAAADPSGAETDESSPVAEGEFAKRAVAEARAQEWVQKGVRLSIIRLPQYVYGRANKTGFAATLIQLAINSGQSFYLGDGNYSFSEVYVDDAADLYFLVAEKAAPGDVFNGSGRTTTTYRELANAIGNLLKVPTRSLSFDEVVAISNPFVASFASIKNRASNRKAVEKLGWRPHGPSLLTEIQTGSYVSVADEFRKQK